MVNSLCGEKSGKQKELVTDQMVLSSPGVYCGDDCIECSLWGRFNEAPKRADGPDGALEPGRLLWTIALIVYCGDEPGRLL